MKKTFEKKSFEEMDSRELAILVKMEMESKNLFEGKRASREFEKMEIANEKAQMLKKFFHAISAAADSDELDDIFCEILSLPAEKLSASDFVRLHAAVNERKF